MSFFTRGFAGKVNKKKGELCVSCSGVGIDWLFVVFRVITNDVVCLQCVSRLLLAPLSTSVFPFLSCTCSRNLVAVPPLSTTGSQELGVRIGPKIADLVGVCFSFVEFLTATNTNTRTAVVLVVYCCTAAVYSSSAYIYIIILRNKGYFCLGIPFSPESTNLFLL